MGTGSDEIITSQPTTKAGPEISPQRSNEPLKDEQNVHHPKGNPKSFLAHSLADSFGGYLEWSTGPWICHQKGLGVGGKAACCCCAPWNVCAGGCCGILNILCCGFIGKQTGGGACCSGEQDVWFGDIEDHESNKIR